MRNFARRLFRSLASYAAMLGMASLLARETAEAQTKVSQSTAKYQDHPNGGNSCAACNYFRPPNAGQLVEGTISPAGWCSLFPEEEDLSTACLVTSVACRPRRRARNAGRDIRAARSAVMRAKAGIQ